MAKTINILGAFDRNNYGDLLFPILIEKYLKKYRKEMLDNYEIKYYGLVDADWTSVGGKKVGKLSRMYSTGLESDSLVIVSGGEVIGAKNSRLYLDLCKNYHEYVVKSFFLRVINRLIGVKRLDNLINSKFGLKSNYPWIINKDAFSNRVHIFYNSVGGRVPIDNFDYYQKLIAESDYVSVRDTDILSQINIQKATLSPDSAMIMSDIFPLNELNKYIRNNVREFVSSNQYICFQTNLTIYKKHKSEIIKQLSELKKKEKDITILLIPIGYATNHDDHIALRDLERTLPNKVKYIEQLSIHEIMYLIACSELFIGSSLHGNITAMSYSVPHLGIGKKQKVESYLKTWATEELNHCINIGEINEYFDLIKSIDKSLLDKNRKQLIEKVMENYSVMFYNL